MSATLKWESLGRILQPIAGHPYLSTHTGATFAKPTDDPKQFDLYVTGRDARNRSTIIRCLLDLPNQKATYIGGPVLGPGALGCFDESGVSYPCLVQTKERTLLYYTGWVAAHGTLFHNHIGLADLSGKRLSNVPVIERTHAEPLSTGACFVMRDGKLFRMWYIYFTEWTNPSQHRYHIRHATSEDGLHWKREGHVCIDYRDSSEYAISRPSVIKTDQLYHMWFCARGDLYQLEYATSRDGLSWDRHGQVAMDTRETWEDSRAYPNTFRSEDDLYMTYAGSDYGKGGLGLAVCRHFFS